MVAEDLFETPLDQAEIDFENEGGETYICGNPPYLGSQWQSDSQKTDLKNIFDHRTKKWKSLDYVAGWFMKAADYGASSESTKSAFVSTNSICQGRQVETLWTLLFQTGHEIFFAHSNFKWSNLATHNAGVTVVIVGISNQIGKNRRLFHVTQQNETIEKKTDYINAYLISAENVIVGSHSNPISDIRSMSFGNMPNDDGYLLLNKAEFSDALKNGVPVKFLRPFWGSQEFIQGRLRFCLWISDEELSEANSNPWLLDRFKKVKEARLKSGRKTTQQLSSIPHKFGEVRQTGNEIIIVVPSISSENRPYLPCGLLQNGNIISNKNFALYDAPLWNMALIASRLHWVWIATVCVRMRTDFSYSNTLGWNTFPVPTLTEKNKADLTRCAEDILLAREAHFPATIADLYNPETMPENLRAAHERNDEVLERIYIGRRFRNDTERLEKLFDLYTKMTANKAPAKKATRGKK
jgi:hypothetical protein